MTESVETWAEIEYARRLDASLLTLEDEFASVDDALHAASGAFPLLVRERLCSVGLTAIAERFTTLQEPPPPVRPGHELHQLDHEWYFTSQTATALAARCEAHAPVVCLGTPTVALELAQRGHPVSLVDSNRLTIAEVTSLATDVDVITSDAREGDWPQNASAIVLDPPWSVAELELWLSLAAAHSRPGGLLLMPLPHELIRPSGYSDRAAILRLAEDIGRVSIIPSFVRYDTPRFEYEVLAFHELKMSRPWRQADLLEVRVSGTAVAHIHHFQLSAAGSWRTFILGAQTVKLRSLPRADALHPTVLISDVPGCKEFMLDTVSSRDQRQLSVDVWTSRNRVAQSGDLFRLGEILSALEAHAPLDSLPCSASERESLRRVLELLE